MGIKQHPQKAKRRTNTGKRKQALYPNLIPDLNLKSRSEQLDMDYIDQLNDEEKQWLNKFCGEYVNASLDRQNLKNNLHNTKELKKDCDKRNNDRNADIYSRAKAKGTLDYMEDLATTIERKGNTEDSLNQLLDNALIEDQVLLDEEFYNSENDAGNG